jgi:uncharacterized OB-fold protein
VTEAISDEELLERWPGVRIDGDNAAYYRGLLEHRLLIHRCRQCRTWHNPPRSVCPRCWSREISAEAVSGRGVIDLLTFLHQGRPRPGVDYASGHPVAGVGLVEQPGLRVAAAIVGASHDEIRLGAEVELDWRDPDGRPTPVFRLTGAPGNGGTPS